MKVSYAEFLKSVVFDGTWTARLDVESSEIACTARFGCGFLEMFRMFMEKAGVPSDSLDCGYSPSGLGDIIYVNRVLVGKLGGFRDDYGYVGKNLVIELL